MKVFKRIAFVLIVLSLLLAACQSAAAPTAAPAEPAKPAEVKATPTEFVAPTALPTADPNAVQTGGQVVVGTPQEPETLNPLLSNSSIADAVSSFAVEGLVQINADGVYDPILAEALPTVSEDGLTVTYKLKKDVKFSNGDAFTCADVQYTWDAILKAGASTAGYKDISAVECPDEYTAVIKFSNLYVAYMRLFSYILPKSAGDPADAANWAFNRNPVGTGPWMVKEWKSGDYIEYQKNPTYREPGKPYLDKMIVKVLPSYEVGLQLLGSGEIDTMWDLVESDFPALKELEPNGVSFAAAKTGENEFLVFNFADPKVDAPESAAKNPHPVLADLKVRQAILLGINKQEIVDTLLYGNVKVGTSVLNSGVFNCPQEPSKFDPEAAKALLEEAGWKPGKDGIREKDGVRMSLKIATTAGKQLREQTEQVLVDMMKQIGIEMTIENVPSDSLFAGWDSKGMRKHGAFDVLLYTSGPFGGEDPQSHMRSNYHSGDIPTAKNEGAGNNYSRYANPDVDQWLDEAAKTIDMDKRHELYCKVATQINVDLPRVFLYERLLISGYRTHLQNFRVSPGPSDFTVGSQNWWIKK